MAILSARLDTPDTSWRPWEAQDADGPEDDPEEDGVNEETARLNDYYARMYGTPEQRAAYCTKAPF